MSTMQRSVTSLVFDTLGMQLDGLLKVLVEQQLSGQIAVKLDQASVQQEGEQQVSPLHHACLLCNMQ